MKILSKLVLLALPILAACGGGSGQTCVTDSNLDKSCVANTSYALPEGIWGGATSNGLSVSTLVLENGQYFSVYSSGTTFFALVEGIMTAVNGTFNDNAGVAFDADNAVVASGVNGTFIAKQSFAGTAGTLVINGNYNAVYDTPIAISDVLGTWTNPATTNTTSLTIAADGTFSGTEGTCGFVGRLAPRSTGKHVLDGTIVTGAACRIASGTSVPIEATLVNGTLSMMGVTPQRNAAFVLTATR